MNVNECPIFVSSSDAYSDIWYPFFALFKREWPEYKGRIYLNTQGKRFSFPGLDIVCTNVPNGMRFGKTFKAVAVKIVALFPLGGWSFGGKMHKEVNRLNTDRMQ